MINEENEYCLFLPVQIGFCGACTAIILLFLKFTIGIRLKPEDERRGLDYIGNIVSFPFQLIFQFFSAHGERWGFFDNKNVNGTAGKGTAPALTQQNRPPPPYSTLNSSIQNDMPPRSRSKAKRRSQVRLRPDVARIRPAYSRAQSQTERGAPQYRPNIPV